MDTWVCAKSRLGQAQDQPLRSHFHIKKGSYICERTYCPDSSWFYFFWELVEKASYLTEEEQSRTALTLQRVKNAKERFADPSQWTAQVAMKVLEDVHFIVENYSEKVPASRKEEFDQYKNVWRKKLVKTTALGKNLNSKPLYDALDSALEQSILLLEKMLEMDQ